MATCRWNSYARQCQLACLGGLLAGIRNFHDAAIEYHVMVYKGWLTHRLLGFLNAGLNLLYGGLEVIVDEVDLIFVDDGDGGLGGELFGARPPHSPVPSHASF